MNIVKRNSAISLVALMLIGGSGAVISTAQASECILYTSIDGVTTELCGAESDAILDQVQAEEATLEEDMSADYETYENNPIEDAPRQGVFSRLYGALGGR